MQEKKPKTEIKYFVFYKPYDVLNQFSKERPEHSTLADFLKVEKDVYPVGRLDKDSEGLVILTNDKSLTEKLLNPKYAHARTYMVQLDDDITDKAVEEVARGVEIKLETSVYKTKACIVKKLSKAPALPERNPPVRFRKNIPTSWVKIELREGKNRQVRKMFAKVGFPVLRLVRVQVEELRLGRLEPGEFKEMEKKELFKLLNIKEDINPIIKNKAGKSGKAVKSTSVKPTEKPKKISEKKHKPYDKENRITTKLDSNKVKKSTSPKSTFKSNRGKK